MHRRRRRYRASASLPVRYDKINARNRLGQAPGRAWAPSSGPLSQIRSDRNREDLLGRPVPLLLLLESCVEGLGLLLVETVDVAQPELPLPPTQNAFLQ